VPAQIVLVVLCLGGALWHESPEFRFQLTQLAAGLALAFVAWRLRDWLGGLVGVLAHQRRVERMQRFADQLEEGRIQHVHYQGGRQAGVRGRRHGVPVWVETRREPRTLHLELFVEHAAVEFDVARAGLSQRLRGSMFLGGPLLRDAGRQARLDGLLRQLLARGTLDRVVLEGDRLVGQARGVGFTEQPAQLLARLDALARVARLCRRTAVQVAPLPGVHFAWGEGGSLRCPYCHDGLGDGTGDPLTSCPGCRTLHHTECYREAGGCTLLGCAEATPWWELEGRERVPDACRPA
jgi:hypothetical protein